MKEKSEINKAVVKAMEEFENVLDVIYAMLNDDYVSVSNIARLLNKILDTDRITASKLNKVLAKLGILKKVEKQDYDLLHQQGLKPSRYLLNDDRLNPYSQKRCGDDYSFYIFNGRIYLLALEIDVIHNEVTAEMAIKLINLMRRGKYADVNTVKANLETFQLLMKHIF